MRTHIAAFTLMLLTHGLAAAGGYQDWRFGMSQAQVRTVGDPARYYAFKNGDLGVGRVPFEDGDALLSFYFTDGHMQRAMLIPYAGEDAGLARRAWMTAYAHLARVCGAVALSSARNAAGTLDAALADYDLDVPLLAPGTRHQMGCLHMPEGARVWASATRGAGSYLMVAVNYGEP